MKRSNLRGAVLTGQGTHFGLYSASATRVELCLLREGHETRVDLLAKGPAWHAFVPGVRAGDAYGYRVHGPYDPERGHRFDAQKLLVDPYARALRNVAGEIWSVVSAPLAHADEARPCVPWRDTVLYELHVKGYTKAFARVPCELRGTFLGLASEPVLAHLRSLGVTSIELMPVAEALTEPSVSQHGLVNYWGYSPLGWFAPDRRFACDPEHVRDEFRTMVRRLHEAGIEVILDVVFNHTCEVDEKGPTILFRGIDNRSFYKLDAEGRYVDWTGCGNTLDTSHPEVVRLLMDSLRFWAEEMFVDGFRFDLGATLGRDPLGTRDPRFSERAPLLAAIVQDPVLSQLKLIAEPWDVSGHAPPYGRFPVPFREWNGRFRDAVRRFWNVGSGPLSELGYRLSGSSDLFRAPTAGINFITAHDGFTLWDLVSYERKHNEDNREGNHDGADENLSTNSGFEGETGDPEVRNLRIRRVRGLMALLILSPGVPMLTAGDEFLRTQRGNNNAYCQDQPLSWVDWERAEEPLGAGMLQFVRELVRLRRELEFGRVTTFFSGAPVSASGSPDAGERDLSWWREDGVEMQQADWNDGSRVTLAVRFASKTEGVRLLLLNASEDAQRFKIPGRWRRAIGTEGKSNETVVNSITLPGISFVFLRSDLP